MRKGIIIALSVLLGIILFVGYCVFDSREKITDIKKYEKYLGQDGKYVYIWGNSISV